VAKDFLRQGGTKWLDAANPDTGKPKPEGGQRFGRQQSFPQIFDTAFADSLARMLGGIPVRKPNRDALIALEADCSMWSNAMGEMTRPLHAEAREGHRDHGALCGLA
jgi:hypothetical protein